MSKLRLWISPATCSLLPHILLRESGLEFDLFTVDITKTYGFPKEYEKINPKKRLPILELGDGEILTETVAISTWISLQVPDKHLFGSTPVEIARSYEWLNWLSGTLHERGYGAYFRPDNYVGDEKSFDSVKEKSRDWITQCYTLIEEKLKGLHAVGESFTVADVFLYVIYRWGYLLEWDMAKLYPKYTRLVEEVVRRESVLTAASIEGIPLIKDNRLGPRE
eukprot:TRINITY_DN2495_c0_g1_i1.p1 TRINITY_DN2495_c0_g1~~TRINITY_DN2495_c0_g1_i1.p1  ORF type:complete len:233 (+),score=43.61 TRINITY_DN2495_c0_g1_i1:34-699(+)